MTDGTDELKMWKQNAPDVSTIKPATVSMTLPQDTNTKGTKPIDPARKKPMVVKRIHKESYNTSATYKLREGVSHCDIDEVRRLLERGADPNKYNVLRDAVSRRDTPILQLLLENGADPNKDDVVCDAVYGGDTATLQVLLENGADPNKTNALQYALSNGHLDIVDVLLEGGADPHLVKDFELIHAAMKGHIDTVEKLLEQGAVQKTHALRCAASSGHIDIVKLLLDKGADPNKADLRELASHGHTEIVKLLLDKGAHPDQYLALSKAASHGHTEIVKLLLDKGAHPDQYFALRGAASHGHTEIVKLLLDKGTVPDKYLALSKAASHGHTEIVKLLLDKGAHPDQYLALSKAASHGHTEIVKLLWDKGAHPDQYLALSKAASHGHTEIVKLLLDKGAHPDQYLALSKAASHGRTEIVKLLLGKGTVPDKYLALGEAASLGHTEIVKLLLDKGTVPDKYFALGEAASHGHTEIVKLLLDKGTVPDKYLALSKAASHGHTEIVKLLLDKGAHPDQYFALGEAASHGHTEIVKLLLDKGTVPDKYFALGEAASHGHTEIVKLLLDKGTVPDKTFALSEAASHGHTEIVKLLLDKGGHPDKAYPLREAASHGHIEIVKLLLDKGADPDQYFALGKAASHGHTEIVKLLLDKGAHPDQYFALRGAASHGHTEIVNLLLDKGAHHVERLPANRWDRLLDNTTDDHDSGIYSTVSSSILSWHKEESLSEFDMGSVAGMMPGLSLNTETMLTEKTVFGRNNATWFKTIVKENNMDNFNALEKTFRAPYREDDSRESLLHIVAVYGTAEMVERMQTWTTITWDETYAVSEHTFGDALGAIAVEKATALYVATFLDRTEMVGSLVKFAGEDNIRCCFQNIQFSNKMEQIYILEIAKRLKQKHSELQPAVVPGHQQDEDGVRSRVFIVYSPSVIQASEYNFSGLGVVKLRNPYVVSKATIFESDIKVSLSETCAKRTDIAIHRYREGLWKKHSNLNIITGSHIKFRRDGSHFEEKTCVVLYCSTKGVIPLGEEDFPRRLRLDTDDYIDVDVREGFFEYGYNSLPSTYPHPTLKMGCNIGRLMYDARGNLIPTPGGTLGPFVRYNNNLGFLTCAHILFDIPSPTTTLDITVASPLVSVVQPSTDASTFQVGASPCGYVERALFDPTRNPSVDAAVVILTDPSRVPSTGQFSNEVKSSYTDAEFQDLPEYNSGAMLSVTDVRGKNPKPNVVKFGSKTDVTRGALSVFGADVRMLSAALGLPSGVGDVVMMNQYQVIGIHPSANFIEKGDSGSAVFCKDNNGGLHCIGMAIGSVNVSDYQYRAGVVTPIEAVLQALGPNITLATFP